MGAMKMAHSMQNENSSRESRALRRVKKPDMKMGKK
jgi:hypothetical protein